jgi:hypothetical protein
VCVCVCVGVGWLVDFCTPYTYGMIIIIVAVVVDL